MRKPLPPDSLHVTMSSMTSRARVSEYRQRMRERGYRPVQIWVPDVRGAAFADEAKRQAKQIAIAEATGDEQTYLEAVSAPWDDEPRRDEPNGGQ